MKKKMNQSRHSSHSRMIRQFSIVFNDDGQRGDLIGTIHCCTTPVFIVMIMALNRLFKVNECGCEASHTLLLCSFLETVDATWPWHVNRFRMKIIFDQQKNNIHIRCSFIATQKKKKKQQIETKTSKTAKTCTDIFITPTKLALFNIQLNKTIQTTAT